MDSLERLMSAGVHQPAVTAATRSPNTFVQANLCSVIGRKGRHLTGTFCLTGDTMEGIIQCLVFLKAFSVRIFIILFRGFKYSPRNTLLKSSDYVRVEALSI